jgi:pimeloyl-ACP methyl ester carboxylesterase
VATTNHYDDVGAGFPVVLIHGHPFDRTMWAPQVEFLRSRYRVITPDLRGYGRNLTESEITPLSAFAEDISQLLTSLGIERFVLGGLSMGGQIVLECYRRYGHRIAGLILADTFAQLDTPQRKQARLDTANRLLREGMDQYSAEELPKMIAPQHVKTMPDVAAHVLRMMKATPPTGAAAALRGRAQRIDYTPLLSEIRVPALIIVGDQDQYTPVSDARFMHDRISNSELVIIEDAGHMPNLEQPDAFNSALSRFLAAVTAA